ncbi:hypothetical protein [Methanobrevibacter smithii]|uniref:hypothetical protein n=1 Tax=Methanobrevibacter smithii TaxID=2173 RepID=UPI0037DC0211
MEEVEFLSAVNLVIRNLKTKQINLSYSITGSSVFAILGIRPWDTVKDIDIILYNPTKETLSLLDSISTITSNNNYPTKSLISINYINNSNKPIKIDFFISDPDLESIPKIFYKEHPIIKIPEILKAKKSYNRDKDKLDIMNIVKFFLNSI